MLLQLEYFYGGEAEQFSFYRIPKILFTDARYKPVSVEAKVLYGLMLDRMSLSLRSGWLDDHRRVYIYFTMEDAIEQLNIGKDKAVKLFKELSSIGLIERKKQGQGKPTKIYVKNFIPPQIANPDVTTPLMSPDLSASPDSGIPKTSEKQKSKFLGMTGAETSEIPKSKL